MVSVSMRDLVDMVAEYERMDSALRLDHEQHRCAEQPIRLLNLAIAAVYKNRGNRTTSTVIMDAFSVVMQEEGKRVDVKERYHL